MAEGPDPVTKNALELEQEITCGICHEHYQEPKIFPCCHYYCKQCVINLARCYQANQPFPCPDCREPTVLPENNADKLPTAFFINRMKALHSRMEKADGKVEAHCEMCSGGGKSVAFCRQCTHFICKDCVKSHQRIKVFARHTVSTLEELKQGGTKELQDENVPPPKCEVHDEAKKLYCFDCSHFICRDCIVIDHAGHKYEFVKKAAPETRKKLVDHLSPLKEFTVNLHRAVEEVKDTKTAVEANGRSVTEQVDTYFQELHKIIEYRRRQLLEASTKAVQQKMESLTVQEKGINLSLGTVQSLVDFVERTLVNGSDEEVVTMHSQMLGRIEGEVKKQKQGAVNLEPVKEADIGVEVAIAESLRKICQNKARLFQMEVDPLKCTASLRVAEVDQLSAVTVRTYLPNGVLTKKMAKVEAKLKSLVDGSVIRIRGVRQQSNEYKLEYTPKVRGRHQLTITVNNKPIQGSPFSVFVKIPPTKLDKPVRVINGLKGPNYLAFNSLDEMIVTEYSGDVHVLDKNGKMLQSIERSEHGFGNLHGVAADKDDNVYVNDSDRCCLYKFNKERKLVKRFGTNGSGHANMKYPKGLTVHGDRVLVCDSGNNRLLILNTKLECISRIGSMGSGDGQFNNPQDVATDEHGNLYVSDYGNHHIQVLTSEGEYVRTIGSKGRGPGVCVDDCYVYVSDSGNNRVSMFRKDGQFVTSFGESKLNRSYGIAKDRDGFVYVCSYFLNTIVVF